MFSGRGTTPIELQNNQDIVDSVSSNVRAMGTLFVNDDTEIPDGQGTKFKVALQIK